MHICLYAHVAAFLSFVLFVLYYFKAALGQKVRSYLDTDTLWTGWDEAQPALTVRGLKQYCDSLNGMAPLPEGGKKSKVTTWLVYDLVWWGLGEGELWRRGSLGLLMFVLIRIPTTVSLFNGLPSHLTFTSLCGLVTLCRLLKVNLQQERVCLLKAKFK